ncbi:hypothetical protein [Pseudarthrobacter sp. NBSH8]|uniref:hypothetical protein n=1 Tax=Pseudarthrobacter sp. NBSH8 TaxID=2596911 RepID=UPI001624E4BF|nr:hypothetical protein [Pseudarthrobacter sp. NBSH8]
MNLQRNRGHSSFMTCMDFADQKSIVSPVVSAGGWVAVAIIFHRSSVGNLICGHIGETKINYINVM